MLQIVYRCMGGCTVGDDVVIGVGVDVDTGDEVDIGVGVGVNTGDAERGMVQLWMRLMKWCNALKETEAPDLLASIVELQNLLVLGVLGDFYPSSCVKT